MKSWKIGAVSGLIAGFIQGIVYAIMIRIDAYSTLETKLLERVIE